MDDLRHILQQPMVKVQEQIRDFVRSADGFENKVKLYFALVALMGESTRLMRTIDINDFVETLRMLLRDINETETEIAEKYHIQLFQDSEIAAILSDNGGSHLSEAHRSVVEALDEYERIIRAIVMTRDNLPLARQMEQEQNG